MYIIVIIIIITTYLTPQMLRYSISSTHSQSCEIQFPHNSRTDNSAPAKIGMFWQVNAEHVSSLLLL